MDKDIITYGDNYFEEVIDKMILDGIPGMNQAFVDIISNLPRDEKRMTILNLLDKDQNLFNQIKALTDKKINKMEHIEDVVLMLRKYVNDADVEKKKFGEVMTPLDLVKRILSKLPDSVWSNPNLKWLDPANGTGPFPSIVIYKLMKGLESWEPDEEKRYKHILENMIYVVEIQPKNMFLYMCAFDPFDMYELNVYTGSFLEDDFNRHMRDVWKIEKFDIVIGNPPYNQMIDMLFVQKSYNISDITLFVHPSTWLLDEKGKQKKFNYTKNLIANHLESIELFNGNKLFGIQLFIPCTITYLNKNKLNNHIKCIDRINEVEILYYDINQINKFSDIEIYPKLKEKIVKLTKDNIDNHKIFNISTNRNNTTGKISKYSHLNTQNEYYINIAQIRGHVDLNSNKKMVLDDFYTIVTKDNKVERSISNHMFFKFSEKETSENFLKYIKTNFVRFCLAMYKNNSQLECGEMSLIPWLDFTQEWSDEKLYEHFDISEEEIKFIEKHIPNYYSSVKL